MEAGITGRFKGFLEIIKGPDWSNVGVDFLHPTVRDLLATEDSQRVLKRHSREEKASRMARKA